MSSYIKIYFKIGGGGGMVKNTACNNTVWYREARWGKLKLTTIGDPPR
jgi:hypothetical protein